MRTVVLENKKLIAIFLAASGLLVGCIVYVEFFSAHTAAVARVIDGDTIELTDGKKVRLLGIDAPEKRQYYYEESTDRLKQLAEGKKVILEKDVSNRDRYGRLLRYVYVDGLFVNLEMVKEGYAFVFITPKNVKYLNEFLKAENEAKTRGIGIWNLNRS